MATANTQKLADAYFTLSYTLKTHPSATYGTCMQRLFSCGFWNIKRASKAGDWTHM
jgi:hypothetical protein